MSQLRNFQSYCKLFRDFSWIFKKIFNGHYLKSRSAVHKWVFRSRSFGKYNNFGVFHINCKFPEFTIYTNFVQLAWIRNLCGSRHKIVVCSITLLRKLIFCLIKLQVNSSYKPWPISYLFLRVQNIYLVWTKAKFLVTPFKQNNSLTVVKLMKTHTIKLIQLYSLLNIMLTINKY